MGLQRRIRDEVLHLYKNCVLNNCFKGAMFINGFRKHGTPDFNQFDPHTNESVFHCVDALHTAFHAGAPRFKFKEKNAGLHSLIERTAPL